MAAVLFRGTGWTGGQWPPKVVAGAGDSGTVRGISSSRPFDVQLYDGASTLIYRGGKAEAPKGSIPCNYPVNNAAFSVDGLSVAYTGGLFIYSASGSDIVITI